MTLRETLCLKGLLSPNYEEKGVLQAAAIQCIHQTVPLIGLLASLNG